MSPPETLVTLALALREQARACRHRRMLLLSGDADWCRAMAARCLTALPAMETLWIGSLAPPGVQALSLAAGLQVLGSEHDLLVLDAHEGFDPDVFGAASGAVRGGGLLFLLSPPLEQWPTFPDPQQARISVAPCTPENMRGRFLARLVRLLPGSEGVVTLRQGEAVPDLPLPVARATASEPAGADGRFRSADQRLAVAAVLHTATGHRRRPLVLTADRGRGKTAAFGLAAAELLLAGRQRILVTAPRSEAVRTLFAQARVHLPGAELGNGRLVWEGAVLEFLPPDILLRDRPDADLLLVDEAAGIPLAMLECLLQHYARIAFASTVHGYEGTGRGFALKFHALLDRQAPGWQLQALSTPIRWAADDPMEATVNRVLLLDAEIAADTALAQLDPAQCRCERLDRDALAGDEQTLRQLFGLLVLSHYRTRPFDLRHLLDGPNLELFALRHGETVVATALLAREGELGPELAGAIFRGERRVQGHLLPQSLVANLGLEAAAAQRFGRIMRIAVHPRLQGRGLGSRLLASIEGAARQAGLDWLGSSFGLAPELLDFWQGNGYRPVRIGMRREASSGAHSALLLRPLCTAAEALMFQARQRFQEQLPCQLADSHRTLEAALVRRLWSPATGAPPLTAAERRELDAFACARRGYEDSILVIGKLVRSRLAQAAGGLSDLHFELLVRRVLQHQGWDRMARELGLTGRTETLAGMRAAIAALLG